MTVRERKIQQLVLMLAGVIASDRFCDDHTLQLYQSVFRDILPDCPSANPEFNALCKACKTFAEPQDLNWDELHAHFVRYCKRKTAILWKEVRQDVEKRNVAD